MVIIRAARCDNATRPLCFAAVYFFLFFLFFSSARDLRGLSADRREALPHDRKWVQFLKTRSKIWGPPPKKSGPKTCFFGAISDDFAIRLRISPERNKISTIGKRRCKLRSPASADVTW